MSKLVELNVALCKALGLETDGLQAATLRIRADNLPTIVARYVVLDDSIPERVRFVVTKHRLVPD